MIRHCPSEEDSCALLVDGVVIVFSCTLDDINVSTHTSHTLFETDERDYGHFWNSENFCYEENLFTDLKSFSSKANITPMQQNV